MSTDFGPPATLPLAAIEHRGSYEATAARIARRTALFHMPPGLVLPLIGGLLVLVADTQALALIPLQGSLVTTYHLSATQAAWTLSAASIATCAMVPILARLSDRFGLRRLFLVSLGLVTIGQLVCSLAGNFEVLVIGRSVLGCSAGAALVFSLIRETSKNEHELNRNSGVITSAIGGGIALSFLVGGAVLRLHGSVSDFFWIVTAVCAALWLLSWLFLNDSPVRARSRVDWLGAALLAGALVSLVLAVSQGNAWGWTATSIVTLFIVGGALAVAWTLWELRVAAPMVNLRVVSRRTIWPALVVYGIANSLGIYTSLTVSGYVQTPSIAGYGMSASPLMAGVYLLPISIPIALGGFLAGPIIRRIGAGVCLTAGVVVIVADEISFAYNHDSVLEIVVGTFVFGSAYSLVNTAATASFMMGARKGEYGMIASAAAAALALGASVGPAIYVAVLTSKFSLIPGTQTAVPAESNYRTILVYAAVIGVVALIAALAGRRARFSHGFTADAVALTETATAPEAATRAGAGPGAAPEAAAV
ncbi:MFS transporter [Dactylosporangium sp. CA-233914]|uniref:MFS transporter n=1 Tax=Dactylosporangium sp. CA-233914 TaxID=3239934 RepID=UPI003D92C703